MLLVQSPPSLLKLPSLAAGRAILIVHVALGGPEDSGILRKSPMSYLCSGVEETLSYISKPPSPARRFSVGRVGWKRVWSGTVLHGLACPDTSGAGSQAREMVPWSLMLFVKATVLGGIPRLPWQ